MFDWDKIKNSTEIVSFEYHAKLDSTNNRAIEMVRRKCLNYPALILTHQQTAGRGQRERRWWSGEGSLTFSWIISPGNRPQGPDHTLSLIPVTVALAIAEAIEKTTQLSSIELKWPNDLIVAGRKIAGILIETISAESQIVIVGIGVNVNNPDFPRSIETRSDHHVTTPTSVLIETQQTTSLNELLFTMVQQLDIEFDCLKRQPELIVDRCNQRLFQRDASILVTLPGGKERFGVCEGISINGGLILRTINGTEVIFSGTIQAV